MTKTKIAFD